MLVQAVSSGGVTKKICSTSEITLTVNGWSNKSQTISNIPEVTSNNIVFVSAKPTSIDDYLASYVKVVAQASGSLTFECNEVPTSNLVVEVAVFHE